MSSIDPQIQESIRANVRAFMSVRGVTLQQLADKMGIKTQSLQNYFSTTNITARTVHKLSDALGYPYELLINGQPYVGDNDIMRLERRIRRIEEILNIKPE